MSKEQTVRLPIISDILEGPIPRKETGIRGAMGGFQYDRIYTRLEGAFDSTVDFRVEEGPKNSGNIMRIRSMRTVPYDPDWHRLSISENFEVTLEK